MDCSGSIALSFFGGVIAGGVLTGICGFILLRLDFFLKFGRR